MDKSEKLIKEYLKNNLDFGKDNKTSDCPDEEVLLEYFQGTLDKERYQALEHHIAECGFCLGQLNIAFQSQLMNKKGNLEAVPQKLIDKTKSSLGIFKKTDNKNDRGRKIMKKRLFLLGAIFFFTLSFIIPRYFIQFLVATLILGIRWAFESEGGRTLIMVLDSWRHHSQDKDEEISHRLKNHF